jgi:3-phosphoshikimate 1-carboxyvinyltransferase
MDKLKILPAQKLSGEIKVPGDKSISHRAVMLGALAEGETIVNNFLNSADCRATAECFRQMGVELTANGKQLTIMGKGLKGLYKSSKSLDVGNSGTTIRLLSGILAGQDFESTITGDPSIQKRPMKRIAEPLELMGAKVLGTGDQGEIFPPLIISGGKLKGIQYKMPIASAQVKSCLLLAGLYAEGETTVVEPYPSRDHTERMLAYFGVPVKKFKNEISVSKPEAFEGREISVPGDISSAAYFLVAGALLPGSDIDIRGVGTNPTRTGILEVMHRMGVEFFVKDEEIISGEPRANIRVIGLGNTLKGIEIGGDLIPRLIDEIPIICVLATQAEGQTIIKDAKELRVKESDRIRTISTELSKMGAKIEETEDGMIIYGPTKLKAAKIDSHGDHRVAMSAAIAGLIAEGQTVIEDTECIETSFPGFLKDYFKT